MASLNRLTIKTVIVLSLIIHSTFYISTAESATESETENTTQKEYILGIGDIIKIQVWENEDLNRTVEISQEGVFTFPLVGKLRALGLSVFETESQLQARLADGFLVAPQVSVTVIEYKSQKVLIFGEVIKPGTFIIKGATPLLEVIARADGLTNKAGHLVKIVRNDNLAFKNKVNKKIMIAPHSEITMIDLRQLSQGAATEKSTVYGGDSIYVEKIAHIYVTGEVKNPGPFEWEEGLTIRQVISLAGGPSKRASIGRTKVIRIIHGEEKEWSLKMSDLVKPNDIVKVPESYF